MRTVGGRSGANGGGVDHDRAASNKEAFVRAADAGVTQRIDVAAVLVAVLDRYVDRDVCPTLGAILDLAVARLGGLVLD
jgi:hypothetical protein